MDWKELDRKSLKARNKRRENKMNEEPQRDWKELKIDKLPEDILTVDYELETLVFTLGWQPTPAHILYILSQLYDGTEERYRYRKPEPKAPTHEEIMTKWWLRDVVGWVRVIAYDHEGCYELSDTYKTKDWFIDRESADIPPEA